jgi:arsenical pump membrane protein
MRIKEAMLVFFHLPTLTTTLLTAAIATLTLLGVMLRPFKWNEAAFALAGAALLLLLGLITPLDAGRVLLGDWNVFFFFLGMMTISALVDAAGLFDWLASQAATLAKGSTRHLLLNIFLLGCLISLVLSNDATALILTPVVYSLTTRLRLPAMPFLFACTFIADTASFLLPVSNPINIIILTTFHLDLWTFLRLLFLPALAVIAINIGLFFLLYRRQLRGRFEMTRLPPASETIKHPAYFRYACIITLLTALAYVVASATQFPLSIVALAGAICLLGGAIYWKRSNLRETSKQISWPIFGFIAGMFLVVHGLEGSGLTALFGQLLLHLSGNTPLGATLVGTLGAALGSNLINNLSMATVLTSALQGVQHTTATTHLGFIAATIFGCDLGPNLTTVGSLATVLWLLILRKHNMEVSGLDYFKVGILIAPLMLIVGALIIWLLL